MKAALPTQAALRAYAKHHFGEKFESDAECFIDTFLNSQFHEEYPDWGDIADSLSRSSLALLVLPICQALVSSHPVQGDQLAKVMNLYDRVGEWHRGALRENAEVIEALDDVRPLVADWSEGLCLFKLLDYGFRRRAGLSTLDLESAYTLSVGGNV